MRPCRDGSAFADEPGLELCPVVLQDPGGPPHQCGAFVAGSGGPGGLGRPGLLRGPPDVLLVRLADFRQDLPGGGSVLASVPPFAATQPPLNILPVQSAVSSSPIAASGPGVPGPVWHDPIRSQAAQSPRQPWTGLNDPGEQF